MPNIIKPKRSNTAAKVPNTTELTSGELGVNMADRKVYINNGTAVVQVGAGNLSGLGDVAIASPSNGQSLKYNSTTTKWENSTAGAGDVVGPASSTDNALVRFDGTTGKLLQNSTATLDDTGNMDTASVKADYFDLDTAAAAPASAVGREAWDDGAGAPIVGLKGGAVTYYYGQQEFARVYNGSGVAMTKGQVVYIVGAQGNRIDVRLAQANAESTSANTIGLVAEPIAVGAEGWVQTTGPLLKLDTSTLTAGQTIYLSPTTAGAYTTTKPVAPNHLVILGFVERVSATVGSIFLKIDNGYELDELHNVNISSPTGGQLLAYDQTNGYWKNLTLTDGTGISVTEAAGGAITVTNTAPDQTVTLTQGGATTITGTYPNFTISSVNTTYGAATSTALGLIELGSDTQQTVAANAVSATASRSYALQVNSAGQGVVNVPWTDTNSGGTVTSVGGTGTVSGLSLSGTVTTSGNLTLGGTLSVLPSNFASQTANTVLAAPNGTAGVPTFRAIVAADIPTLNQNTTGTASNVTGTVAVANGGTGATTAATARTNLGATTLGGNLYTLANVAAIAFPRFNADNTVSSLDAASFRTAIGAGTSSTTGTVTSVGGTGTVSGLTLSGTVTTSGNLTLGGTLAVTPSNFASQTANTFLAAPNGAAGVPTFRAMVAADVPTLNQNTTGTAANVTGTVAIANGGTGQTTRQNAMDALAGAVTSGQYLRGNGTDVVMSAIQAADVPTLNQSTTGNAATATTATNVSGGTASVTTLTVNSNKISAVNSLGFRNRIINGDMRIDQRNGGASGTATAYTVDRWYYYGSQASKATWQQNAGAVTPPTGFTNYLGATSSSAYSITSTDQFLLIQKIEGLNFGDLAWGTAAAQAVTLSFWVRSSLTGTFGGSIQNSAANRNYPFSFTISAANTWEQKTVAISGDTTGTWLATNGVGAIVNFSLGTGATYSAAAGVWTGSSFISSATGATSVVGTNGATFYITGVQLEAGSVATPFERRDYGRELMMCQRYYQAVRGLFGIINGYATIEYPVTMRAAPTVNVVGAFAQPAPSVVDSGVGNFIVQSTGGAAIGFSGSSDAEL